jgi:hypothetical protein
MGSSGSESFMETANRNHPAGGVIVTTKKPKGPCIIRIQVGGATVTVTLK